MTELLDDIRLKERRYRVAQGIFMIITVAGLLGVAGFEAVILSKVQAQLVQQKETVEELKQNTHDQLSRQTAYILCIAKFFTIPNRQASTLSLEDCAVTTSDATSGTVPYQPVTSPTPTPAASQNVSRQAQPANQAATPPANQAPQRTALSPVIDFVNTSLKKLGL